MKVALVLVLLVATAACRERGSPSAETGATPAAAPAAVEPSVPRVATPEPAERVVAPPSSDPDSAAAEPVVHAEAPHADSARCLARTGERVSREAQAIHRWVDAAGIVHYADRAPVGTVREHRRIALGGLPPVSVEASGYDVNLPADVHARAVADAVAIDRVLRQVFAADSDDRLALRVVFVASAQAYERFVGEPALARSAGAYSARERTVYVRMQGEAASTFRVLRHEIVHALVHERIGNLPTTLNEGLAGYFERFEAAGQGGRVDFSDVRARLAAAAPQDPAAALTELLALDGPDFYRSEPERRYAQALALVAVLMRDTAGRAVLGELLARQRAEPCDPLASEAVFEARYPGGLAALADDLAGWMRAPDAGSHW
ncbi:MAG: hypothetical protein DI564_05130 [Rhodanobacter denitrificans]|uniref:DUF4124 domain-containing protein n=1 Tax=Rhodanobacter denitrificans TaxID=666685 RepID=A0A2W5KV33_9GAMM|nr:MAG: hypothetical protein DI564_05130 [Rhodanobacter denitrificans]